MQITSSSYLRHKQRVSEETLRINLFSLTVSQSPIYLARGGRGDISKRLDYSSRTIAKIEAERRTRRFDNSPVSTFYPTLLFLRRSRTLRKLFLPLAPGISAVQYCSRQRGRRNYYSVCHAIGFAFQTAIQRNWIIPRGGVTDSLFRFLPRACFGHPKPPAHRFRPAVHPEPPGLYRRAQIFARCTCFFTTTTLSFADAFLLRRKVTLLRINLI